MTNAPKYVIWGSVLSPFSLKVRVMCDFMRVSYRWLPEDGSLLDTLRYQWRVTQLKSGRLPLTYPEVDALDEFPLVPFLFGQDGSNLYDSTAIAHWLDARHATESRRLIPKHPLCAFVARLVDEHFDEFGLYVAHHHRWVTSALDNDAGERVANEFGAMLPKSVRRLAGAWFARRQVRRLPYLFSVAPEGFRVPGPGKGFDKRLTPPSKHRFPPTHTLLDEALDRSLECIESVLKHRPFLLGTRFTLADASMYGELGMNTSDPSAERRIASAAPTLRTWLQTLHERGAATFEDGDEPSESDIAPLTDLLNEIARTYVPLMVQNERAYDRHVSQGQTRFNEAAFDRGEALYDGQLLGHPFRAVVKTFQLKGWRTLKTAYANLPDADRHTLPPNLRAAFETTS